MVWCFSRQFMSGFSLVTMAKAWNFNAYEIKSDCAIFGQATCFSFAVAMLLEDTNQKPEQKFILVLSTAFLTLLKLKKQRICDLINSNSVSWTCCLDVWTPKLWKVPAFPALKSTMGGVHSALWTLELHFRIVCAVTFHSLFSRAIYKRGLKYPLLYILNVQTCSGKSVVIFIIAVLVCRNLFWELCPLFGKILVTCLKCSKVFFVFLLQRKNALGSRLSCEYRDNTSLRNIKTDQVKTVSYEDAQTEFLIIFLSRNINILLKLIYTSYHGNYLLLLSLWVLIDTIG